MAISSSLYSSISGLNTMGNAMSVLGDNVANVNTIAFKSSRATFQDVLSQSVSTAAGSAQVGRGVTLSTVEGLFAQGSFESTSTSTDLAIGGQGFFMLRAADNAAADMYSRAGEFRFDQEGYLVNPVGYYAQGWTIDAESGEVSGTIGDINLGKSTPPVATASIDVIVNLDSREVNETNEQRLYDAWNGTNAAAVNPSDPIDVANYEYTSAVKVYDSKGASHDITIYFDRTTNDNEWEYLVTCEPSEDMRYLDTRDQTVYAPNETYNYEEHAGAGALQYGIVNFTTAGDISKISAWSVPPDGKVDISLNDNRLFLDPTDKYYTFEANFTGATTNQEVELNLGAQYGGLPSNQSQILVSEDGAHDSISLTTYITKETTWDSVYDSGGKQMQTGDAITWAGYDHDGIAVSGSYLVDGNDKLSVFLGDIGNDFNATATLDAKGRLRLTDDTGGDSGLYLTNFTVFSAQDAKPFGGTAYASNDNAFVSGDSVDYYFTTDGVTAITSAPGTTNLVGLEDSTASPGVAIVANDIFTFTGTAADGATAVNETFEVGVDGTTVQDMLDFLQDIYCDGSNDGDTGDGTIAATMGADGRVRIVDLSQRDLGMAVTASAGSVSGSQVLGAVAWTAQDSSYTQVDVSSSKTTIVSPGRAFNTNTGIPPVINATTTWPSVFDGSGNAVAVNDTIAFTGTNGNGSSVSYTYTVSADTDTVQDLLDGLSNAFDADAYIDEAGRLNLRDWEANSGSRTSLLAITDMDYTIASGALIFGADNSSFEIIDGSTLEDGSRLGDVVSTTFETEALASTQYANASTTIFQDQNGYAAGFLQSVSVDTDGIITGHYSNGQVLEKAQVALASFNNLAGLNKEGGNIFRETTDSGAPVTGAPGTNGLGSIAPNSLEQSNVDLGNEFVKLITTQRGFQANSKIITTTDEMLADLINIKR